MTEESTSSDPYAVVLADLKAKRAQLDQAIAAIEAVRAASGPGISPEAPVVAKTETIDGPGAFLGLSIVDAAKRLLASRRQPLRNPEIATAFKAGGLVLNSAEPANTIGSVLTRRFNEVGDVVKIDRGTWGLKEWYPNRNFKKDKGDSSETKGDSSDSK